MAILNNKYKQEVIELRQTVDEVKLENAELRDVNEQLTMGGVPIPFSSPIDGVSVTEDKVLKIPTAKACIDLITGSISQMPVYLYRENADGSIEKVLEDKRIRLLNHENELGMDAINFKKLMVQDYILRGQTQAYIRNAESIVLGETIYELQELNHLPAKYVQTDLKAHDGIKYTDVEYRLTQFEGIGSNRKQRIFRPDELLLVLNNPQNAYTAEGVLKRGENIFAQAIAEMEYNNSIYSRGALPVGVLKLAGRASQNIIDNLRASWANLYSGIRNSSKTVILEEGMDYQPISMKPSEMQLNETKKDTASEICKVFGVPESMITTAANKYGSIEQNQLHFLKHCIAPIIGSFESAFDRQLLTESEKREGYFFRFDTSELLRATEKERVEAVELGLRSGLLTINEARSKLDLSNIEDDVFMFGLQTVLYNPKTGEMKVPNMGLTGGKTQNDNGKEKL